MILTLPPERVSGAEVGGVVGELLRDATRAVAQLLVEGASVHIAAFRPDGRVWLTNRAFIRLLGHELVGAHIDSLLIEQSRETLREACAGGRASGFLLLNFLDPQGEPHSLRCLCERFRGDHLLIGEPVFEQHRELEDQLQTLNADLAVLVRESARQTRALAAAHAELRDAHWHIRKIAQVLPMCLVCSKVRTGPETWEDLASYLQRSSDFLSHGYCAGCARRLIAELPKKDGP